MKNCRLSHKRKEVAETFREKAFTKVAEMETITNCSKIGTISIKKRNKSWRNVPLSDTTLRRLSMKS